MPRPSSAAGVFPEHVYYQRLAADVPARLIRPPGNAGGALLDAVHGSKVISVQ
jgi:hypothetical protein